MAEKRLYWIKLPRDFFGSKRMKKLRRMKDGDTLTVIYLKLQLYFAESKGEIVYEGIEPTLHEELALTLDEDPEMVLATLIFLKDVGLLTSGEVSETDSLKLTECLVESETAAAERMRQNRQKKTENEQSYTQSEQCYTENEQRSKEKEIEKEIETDKERDINYQLIADMYNATCVSFPKVTSLSEARKKAIRARMRKYKVEDFDRLFRMTEGSDFLKGANGKNWSATFDWLISDKNMAKVLDGNYNNRDRPVEEDLKRKKMLQAIEEVG